MMADNCGIFEKFGVKNNLIKEYEHWLLVVKKNQGYLGSCVAITKKHHDSLGELVPKEMAEYQTVAHDTETALKKVFDYDGIHHVLLMKKDKHTHFHIVPRFLEVREFAGLSWEDGYGTFVPGTEKNVDDNILDRIKQIIKENI